MPRMKRPKAKAISPALNAHVAALIKGMLERGDRQSDISAYFSINQGRIYEISSGQRFASVIVARPETLPPPGPYLVVTKVSHERAQIAEQVLVQFLRVLDGATNDFRAQLMQTLKE